MIRIDEMYYNVFAAALQDRPQVGLHWFDPFGSVKFEHMINVPAVPFGQAEKRIIFWDQEPFYHDTAQAFLEQFLPKQSGMGYDGAITIVTSERESKTTQWAKDTYGINSAYYFFHGWAALDWYRGYDRTFLCQDWQDRRFKYKFLCPNNIIGGTRSHRVRLFAELCRKNLVPGNLISFPSNCPYEKIPAVELCHQIGIDTDIAPWLPQIIDGGQNHADQSHRIDFWKPGCEAFCHVVTETVYLSDRLHLTEKTFKPIVMQQPFILVAPRGSLSYLRSYGFQTFSEIWDESYDDADDESRIGMIVDLLQMINDWTVSDIESAQHKINRIVQHNHEWFYGGFERVLWQELCEMISLW